MSQNISVDETLEREIERATAPYVGLLPPEALAEVREALREALTTDPVGSSLLRRVKPPPVVIASGDVQIDETAGSEIKDAKSGGSR